MRKNLIAASLSTVGRNAINGYRTDQPPTPDPDEKTDVQNFPPTVIKIEKPSTIFPSHGLKVSKGYSLSEVGMWRPGHQPYPLRSPEGSDHVVGVLHWRNPGVGCFTVGTGKGSVSGLDWRSLVKTRGRG